jgi:hypothetical protein
MEVLILTNSMDGTSDLISDILTERKVSFLRWNIDLWSDYEIIVNKDCYCVSDPTGKTINSNNNLKLLWRKPFASYFNLSKKVTLSEEDEKFAKYQVKEILYSILALYKEKNIPFIDPVDEIIFPKLKQLEISENYFDTLPYEFSIKEKKTLIMNSITKPLATSEVGDKILYTSKLNQDEAFRPFPWFFQEGVLEGEDVTCVFIKGESFFYTCDYKRSSKNIDWRKEINTKDQSKWEALENKETKLLKNKVADFMNKLNLNYGRLDFIKKNNKYYFLECNSGGQFGWLDDEKLTLHNKYLDALLSQN